MNRLLGNVVRMGVGYQSAQLRCGISRAPAGYREMHFCTPQYALVYMPDGKGRYLDARTHRHEIAPGSFIQRFPSRSHSVELEAPTLRCWVAVPCQVFELIVLMGLTSHARPVVYVGRERKLVRKFASLREELEACQERDLLRMLLRMEQFVVELHERGRERRAGEADLRPIARAMQLLSENLSERICLATVARRVGMGYATFRKQFAEHVGSPPGDYRIRRRIERAMAMITQGDLLVKEVAAQLGYPDEYAFSAQFKKMAGIPPREYRRRYGAVGGA